jgi:hypothetical protein
VPKLALLYGEIESGLEVRKVEVHWSGRHPCRQGRTTRHLANLLGIQQVHAAERCTEPRNAIEERSQQQQCDTRR